MFDPPNPIIVDPNADSGERRLLYHRDRPKLHLKFAPRPEIEAATATYAPQPPEAPPPKPRLSSAERLDLAIARLEALRQTGRRRSVPATIPGPGRRWRSTSTATSASAIPLSDGRVVC
jgi:hypothetical protein